MRIVVLSAALMAGGLYAQSLPIVTKVVNTAGGIPTIAPDTWIEIHGTNLAPVTMDWSTWDFATGLPLALAGVSATVNGKTAVISYISPSQINVVAPLDDAAGMVAVQVANPIGESTPFLVNEQAVSPGFFAIDIAGHVAARHLDYSLLGDASLSVPGYAFTPARPGETILLYATGFGETNAAGALPELPSVTVAGIPAFVMYAGLSAAGLYQFNVALPDSAPAGDLTLSATYNGSRTQAGVILAVQ